MPYLSAKRTSLRLLKLASLGLIGLLAGMLSAHNASPASAPTYTRISSDAISDDIASGLPDSIDARQVPSLHHPPSARRLQSAQFATVPQPVMRNQ